MPQTWGNTTSSPKVNQSHSPYVLINIDGDDKPSLETWTATLASSSVLSQFYGNTDTATGVDAVVQ